MNSRFDWYISITNLFTELMIDWSGKETEHLTVAKESYYQPILKESEAQIFQNHSLI